MPVRDTKFKKGDIPWNKGKKVTYSEDTKKRLSEFRKKPHKGRFKKGTKCRNTGRTRFKKGHIPWSKNAKGLMKAWNKGKKLPSSWNKGKIGKDSHSWKGGKSFEPYTMDFNNKFKEAIRERDNNCCLVCNKYELESKKKLSVHHIDYNKINSFFQNCVSLCISCHSKTNFNRNSWTIFFQNLLKERYGYEYTIDQKIILDFTGDDVRKCH